MIVKDQAFYNLKIENFEKSNPIILYIIREYVFAYLIYDFKEIVSHFNKFTFE